MFRMSTIYANTCIRTTTPLRNRCHDHGVVQQPPLLQPEGVEAASADVLSTFNVLSTHIMEPGVKVNGDYYRNTELN